MYYVKVWKLNDWWIMLYFEYSVDALIIKWKIISRSKETRMKRIREAFVKILVKVKLVLVNIRFRLDISMPVMITNLGIGFGAWQDVSVWWSLLKYFADKGGDMLLLGIGMLHLKMFLGPFFFFFFFFKC